MSQLNISDGKLEVRRLLPYSLSSFWIEQTLNPEYSTEFRRVELKPFASFQFLVLISAAAPDWHASFSRTTLKSVLRVLSFTSSFCVRSARSNNPISSRCLNAWIIDDITYNCFVPCNGGISRENTSGLQSRSVQQQWGSRSRYPIKLSNVCVSACQVWAIEQLSKNGTLTAISQWHDYRAELLREMKAALAELLIQVYTVQYQKSYSLVTIYTVLEEQCDPTIPICIINTGKKNPRGINTSTGSMEWVLAPTVPQHQPHPSKS